MDYPSLVAPKSTPGSIASWANYGLAPASDVLSDAQLLLYTLLRTREMLSDSTPIVVGLGAYSVPLPAGFLDPITLRNQYGRQIPPKNVDSVLNRRSITNTGAVAAGQIGVYGIFGEKLQFDAATSVAVTLSMVYFKRPDLLSVSNPTNFLTDRYPFLLRAACLAAAADFRKHSEDYTRNVQKLTTMVEVINHENDLYLRSVEVDADYRSL